jgi:hypothetical protein
VRRPPDAVQRVVNQLLADDEIGPLAYAAFFSIGADELSPEIISVFEGAVYLYWNNDPGRRHYMEIEISEDGRIGWFYKDRATGLYDGSDNDDQPPFSSECAQAYFALVKGECDD